MLKRIVCSLIWTIIFVVAVPLVACIGLVVIAMQFVDKSQIAGNSILEIGQEIFGMYFYETTVIACGLLGLCLSIIGFLPGTKNRENR